MDEFLTNLYISLLKDITETISIFNRMHCAMLNKTLFRALLQTAWGETLTIGEISKDFFSVKKNLLWAMLRVNNKE